MRTTTSQHLKSVLYLDRGILVLNKLPGLICQLEGEQTVKKLPKFTHPKVKQNQFSKLLSRLQEKYDLPSRPYPVHRLDAGTTGCLALAVSPPAAREISRQFAQGHVHKTYLALVRGGAKSFPGKSGRIEDPMIYEDGFFQGYDASGKPSVTEWELLAHSPLVPVSLVRLKLLTGNKHQLRIHLAKSLNAPILGDTRYSQTLPAGSITSQIALPPDRIYLHASQLSLLRYRTSGSRKRFRLGIQAPLPPDFTAVCEKLRIPIPRIDVEGGLFMDGERVHDSDIPDLQAQWLHTERLQRPPKLDPIPI